LDGAGVLVAVLVGLGGGVVGSGEGGRVGQTGGTQIGGVGLDTGAAVSDGLASTRGNADALDAVLAPNQPSPTASTGASSSARAADRTVTLPSPP
jgi:hypothetical protein